MHTLIFGATGGTGRQLVSQALRRGHDVSALIPGHEAVLSALGTRSLGPTTLPSDAAREIVGAMQTHAVRRIVWKSSLGIGETRGQLGPLYNWLLIPLVLRHVFADKERAPPKVDCCRGSRGRMWRTSCSRRSRTLGMFDRACRCATDPGRAHRATDSRRSFGTSRGRWDNGLKVPRSADRRGHVGTHGMKGELVNGPVLVRSSGHQSRRALAPFERRRHVAPGPIPEGYHTATPYLIIKGAAEALEFYKKAFGARETMRLAAPDGQIGHVEIRIGDSPIMLADEYPDMGYRSPRSLGGSPVSILLYVEDVDRWFERAIAAGGKVMRPVADQFYGDRTGTLIDPFGHVWSISTHVEDVSPEEMQRRG